MFHIFSAMFSLKNDKHAVMHLNKERHEAASV